MRVLVTGAHGLLGGAVVREFSRDHDVLAYDRLSLDITDDARVKAALARERPDAIINCAAYNNVDEAEDRAGVALDANAFGVLALARAVGEIGSLFVHYSSDFVFDGEAGRPYVEDDEPNPRGTYAASKLLGEWFALAAPNSYVLRVESLFGEPAHGTRRRGSLAAILDGLRRGDEVPVFVDRTVSPSYTADVAFATRKALTAPVAPGLYHCVNGGAATWAEIAAAAAGLLCVSPRLKPIPMDVAGLKAPRPRYCALSNAKLARAGVPLPSWQDALARHIATLS